MNTPEALSGEQFRDHLDEFHRQLGLEFGPNSIRLPGGAHLPTASQSVDVTGLPHVPPWPTIDRILYAQVPSEAGNLHLLSAHLYGGRSNVQSNISFDTGKHQTTGSAFWTPHREQYGPEVNEEHFDPVLFQNRVRQIMSDTPSPAPNERAGNMKFMRHWQSTTGEQIQVRHEPVWGKSTRYYHFNVGSGKLLERP